MHTYFLTCLYLDVFFCPFLSKTYGILSATPPLQILSKRKKKYESFCLPPDFCVPHFEFVCSIFWVLRTHREFVCDLNVSYHVIPSLNHVVLAENVKMKNM